MSGSGARDGFGSPPWDPAEPAPHPDLQDTQALPGLGSVPPPAGAGGGSGYGSDGRGGDSGYSDPRYNDPGYSDPRYNDPRYNDPRSNGGSLFDATGKAGRTGNGGNGGNAGRGSGRADETRVDLTAAVDDDEAGRDGGPGGGRRGGQNSGGQNSGGQQKRRRSFWRELPVLVVVALVLALLIKSFVIQAFYIPSASMENTLEIGDRVLINKVVYHTRPIHRGDIVVFDGTGSWDIAPSPASTNIFSKAVSELEGIVGISHDSNIYIKRVIGVPGDHVVCCNSKGQITVNGVALSEASYIYPGNGTAQTRFNIVVPPGRLWVMGDNRQVSYDSRGHMGDPGGGTIPESGVLGRAFVIIWPPSRWGFLNIPATFEQPQLNASNAAAGGSTAALAAALDNGTPVQAAGSALPLGLGFLGAVPVTLLQRTARRRLKNRRSRRHG